MKNLRKHIIISDELDKRIWEFNGPNKKNYSRTVAYLIEKGLDNLFLNEHITFYDSMLDKIYARNGYSIDLIEHLYKELDMKDKLENFKKNRFKDSKYVK